MARLVDTILFNDRYIVATMIGHHHHHRSTCVAMFKTKTLEQFGARPGL